MGVWRKLGKKLARFLNQTGSGVLASKIVLGSLHLPRAGRSKFEDRPGVIFVETVWRLRRRQPRPTCRWLRHSQRVSSATAGSLNVGTALESIERRHSSGIKTLLEAFLKPSTKKHHQKPIRRWYILHPLPYHPHLTEIASRSPARDMLRTPKT